MNIEDGTVPTIHYTITNDDGVELESSRGGPPHAYLHGHQPMLSGLEKALAGKSIGVTFQVSVAPADGYGEATHEREAVPRNAFPPDMELSVGLPLRTELPEQGEVVLWIQEIDDDKVWVSLDHPLAGQTLHFEVEVIDVRTATDEEVAHGHVH